MSNDAVFDLPEDIDARIIAVCDDNPNLEPRDVIRDLTRIACIANMVNNGYLDPSQMVLAGGMAMRCLKSNRMSIYDADLSSATKPNSDRLQVAMSLDDEDLMLKARKGEPRKKLETFKPVKFDAYFSGLDGASGDFSIDVSYRGIEMDALEVEFVHGYEFSVLSGPSLTVPILNPVEMLAEKTTAWVIHGHAKHYFDIAYLSELLSGDGVLIEQRAELRRVFRLKLDSNREISSRARNRVDSLTLQKLRAQLTNPEAFMDDEHSADTLAYIRGTPPLIGSATEVVTKVLVPLFMEDVALLN